MRRRARTTDSVVVGLGELQAWRWLSWQVAAGKVKMQPERLRVSRRAKMVWMPIVELAA